MRELFDVWEYDYDIYGLQYASEAMLKVGDACIEVSDLFIKWGSCAKKIKIYDHELEIERERSKLQNIIKNEDALKKMDKYERNTRYLRSKR